MVLQAGLTGDTKEAQAIHVADEAETLPQASAQAADEEANATTPNTDGLFACSYTTVDYKLE